MTLRCRNPLCRDVVRTGRPRYLAEVADVEGAEAHIPCPSCGQTTHWKARADSPVAGPRMSVVGLRH